MRIYPVFFLTSLHLFWIFDSLSLLSSSYLEFIYKEVKWSKREAHHSFRFNIVVVNAWSYTFICTTFVFMPRVYALGQN
jgi:hypothetical protein